MDSPSDWPSLADELELADELSWLERQAARVDDPDFASLFSDHIDIPGVTTDDYLHRRTRSSSAQPWAVSVFYGRDISRPFVEIIAHSFNELDRLCDCVRQEWSMFAPPVLRLRTRPDRLTGVNVVPDEAFTPPASAIFAHRPDTSGSNPSTGSSPPKRWSVRAIDG